MIEFKYQYDEESGSPSVVLNLSHSDYTLSEVCQEFENFLLACSYHFSGHVAIVDDDVKGE